VFKEREPEFARRKADLEPGVEPALAGDGERPAEVAAPVAEAGVDAQAAVDAAAVSGGVAAE
jgi:hypothetical protein